MKENSPPSLPKPEILSHSRRGWGFALCLFLLFVLQSHALSGTQPNDTFLLRDGEALLSKGQTEKALWRFKKLVDDYPQSPLFNDARFQMGVCYTHLKRPQDAVRILNELLTTFLSPERMVHVFTFLGDNHLEMKDTLSALHWYGKGILVPGPPHDDLKGKVRSILDAIDKEEELKRVESSYRGSYLGGYAKSRLAQIAKRQGNDPSSRKILTELERKSGAQPRELPDPPRAPEKPGYTVGVILPLSGAYQSFGEKTLQAIQLAMRETDRKKGSIGLAIRDSKGNPGEAERAVEELATKERAIAILGPLLTVTVDGAARKAHQLKIPLMTFSQRERIYGKSDFVFQNSLTPSDQVSTLAEFAIRELDLHTFAVFYPNSPYGLHFKNLFVQEVTRRGRKVLGVVAFQEGQTDFGKEIKGLFKLEAYGKKGDQFSAGLSVDGLFIPDTHTHAGPIISQVAYYDIKGITFLGTNAWHRPELISIAGNAAEGATFVDVFSKSSPSLPAARFVEEIQQSYKRDPETLEALCYDGARLLRDILLTKQISSPAQLKEELRQVRNYNGITGLRGFGEDGKAIRTLSILRISKGQIERISGP